jgi:maleate cis-trans isomerase
MVEALRELGVDKVALNGVYHWPDWWQGTAGFLKEAGFDVVWAGNFVDQGWFKNQEALNACIWCFDGDLARKSFEYIATKAPNVDAYLAIGMSNYRRDSDGLAQRFVSLEVGLEKMLGKPLITHDNALYWRLFKTLGLAPVTEQGNLLSSLKD